MTRIKKSLQKTLLLLLGILLLFGSVSSFAEEGSATASPAVADASQMTTVEEVVEEGMVPVPGTDLVNGTYSVAVESSSSMFRIDLCMLSVLDGEMKATLVMSGKSYLYLYPGTALEAATSEEQSFIAYSENEEGKFCFTIPVEALDAGIPCAAFSKNKQLWYDRTLLFRADSLPASAFRSGVLTTAETLGLEDGNYTVEASLSGGSGKAGIASPVSLTVQEGVCTARIQWSSRNYDYMIVEGVRYLPIQTEEFSTFMIPVALFDRPMAVIADTVAMGQPHEIKYRIRFDSSSLQMLPEKEVMPLQYAQLFKVEGYDDLSLLLTLGGKDQFLLVPKGIEITGHFPERIPIIPIPIENGYAASSSVPDLFLNCGALSSLRFTSTEEQSWKIDEICKALQEENLLYTGKYSAPDYELLLEEGCELAIENTMILHSPRTKEKLEAIGIPVMIEYSSYEPHPLGRVEWIKLWGLLTGHLKEASEFFNRQSALLEELAAEKPSGKTAAFFYITSAGTASVRKNEDYVTCMIELAGGKSPFLSLPESENALSSVTIQMESFYSQAKDADVLIYNSTVAGELNTIDDLMEKSSMFSDFNAVKTGNVWCTEQSMFQRSSAAAEIISELHALFTGTADNLSLQYFHPVK